MERLRLGHVIVIVLCVAAGLTVLSVTAGRLVTGAGGPATGKGPSSPGEGPPATGKGAPGAPSASPSPRADLTAEAGRMASANLRAANDFGCRPREDAPHPVVLVHGARSTGAATWPVAAPYLTKQGYCVFALDYGWSNSVERSARTLGVFVEGVLQATGARQVAIVGHSLGGIVPRAYMRSPEGAGKVAELITLGAPHHRPTGALARSCGRETVCAELRPGSPLMRRLSTPSMVEPGVDYTALGLRAEQEAASTFVEGPPERVTNRLLQDDCPLKGAVEGALGHNLETLDPVMLSYVNKALETAGPMPRDYRPDCFALIL